MSDKAIGDGARDFVEEDRAPMGMTVRVFIYLVAVHFIVAFFFLLFYLGGARE
ncbi:DUF6126 family protein [Streptomyces griseocarneus]|uniref:DUF6126 family protein n=1 Tax=Streptomyces griseocarneus TaxID=51201 RepID=UPI00167E7450|nr:DUF6126 family protein [Streptomyces griseocarneus]MBZ6472698.1 DUF6126 family protein [Streptomyces griseocarneus]GHG46804.1 hypothetical protein GCM10018779_03560 [Streptomyces griseocarneus]